PFSVEPEDVVRSDESEVGECDPGVPVDAGARSEEVVTDSRALSFGQQSFGGGTITGEGQGAGGGRPDEHTGEPGVVLRGQVEPRPRTCLPVVLRDRDLAVEVLLLDGAVQLHRAGVDEYAVTLRVQDMHFDAALAV